MRKMCQRTPKFGSRACFAAVVLVTSVDAQDLVRTSVIPIRGDAHVHGAALVGGTLYLAGATDLGGDSMGFLVELDVSGSEPTLIRTTEWPSMPGPLENEALTAVVPLGDGFLASGLSYSRTTDGRGSKEFKGVIVELRGEARVELDIAELHIFPYDGFSALIDLAIRPDTGEIIAVGREQAGGSNHTAIAQTFDSSGLEAGSAWILGDTRDGAGSEALAIEFDGEDAWIAGSSRPLDRGEPSARATLWRLSSTGDLLEVPFETGHFRDLVILNGNVMGVGGLPSRAGFLLGRRDVDGRVESMSWRPESATGTLVSAVAVGSRLFVLGDVTHDESGRAQIEVQELDASDGSVQWSNRFDDGTNLRAAKLLATERDLLVVGESDGNLLIVRYALSRNALFVRGDSNVSGSVDISDAVHSLNWLFLGGATPACLDAADADDSQSVTLTDAVFTLDWLFRGGVAPPTPGPSECGEDVSDDDLPECSVSGCGA